MRLREELFLLGHDQRGRPVVHPDRLDLGVAGAFLVELALAGRLVVSGGHVAVADSNPTADAEIDHLLLMILRARSVPGLTAVLDEIRVGAADRARAPLAATGVVRSVTVKRLGLIPVIRHPADEAVVRRISVGLWYAAQGDGQPDDRTSALLALVHAVLLHEHVFANIPMTGLAARLRGVRDRAARPVREIATAVGGLAAGRAVAGHR